MSHEERNDGLEHEREVTSAFNQGFERGANETLKRVNERNDEIPLRQQALAEAMHLADIFGTHGHEYNKDGLLTADAVVEVSEKFFTFLKGNSE